MDLPANKNHATITFVDFWNMLSSVPKSTHVCKEERPKKAVHFTRPCFENSVAKHCLAMIVGYMLSSLCRHSILRQNFAKPKTCWWNRYGLTVETGQIISICTGLWHLPRSTIYLLLLGFIRELILLTVKCGAFLIRSPGAVFPEKSFIFGSEMDSKVGSNWSSTICSSASVSRSSEGSTSTYFSCPTNT